MALKMSAPSSAEYSARIENDLVRNILPFWMQRVVNPDGGFYGALENDDTVDPNAERGALLSSRILWTFSAAFSHYRDPAYLAVAHHAYRDLIARFHDAQNGGFWWSIAADGRVLRDRKQVYGHAFAVYALAEYHAATGAAEP